jgi:hypothetical protein
MATAAVDWGVFSRAELLAVEPDFYVATPSELLALCLDGTGPVRSAGDAGEQTPPAPPDEGAARGGCAP